MVAADPCEFIPIVEALCLVVCEGKDALCLTVWAGSESLVKVVRRGRSFFWNATEIG